MQGTSVRGIRGAIDVTDNDAHEILEATKELLQEMLKKNSILKEDLASVIFSMTSDLNAAFPAKAARQIGWTYVPLFDTSEIDVPGSLPRCIRILMLANTTKKQEEIRHVYLKGAVLLRTDLHTESK